MKSRLALSFLTLAISISSLKGADDFERQPIVYSKSTPDNIVSRLQQRIDNGTVKLAFDMTHGYLPAVLKELKVPVSSQTLVFSKTSLQRHRIGPKSPRALYFNDEIYVGYCQLGSVLEFSASDPKLGTVFYTLDQEAVARPKFTKHTDECFLCHASSQTRGVPGHLVRSVFADIQGLPIFSSGSFRIDQQSPLNRRWGGWYVTGKHGTQTHLGNVIFKNAREPDAEQLAQMGGLNLTDLKDRFPSEAYLASTSDIVALMVLEHQTEMHNLITRANFQTRQAIYEESILNKELKRDPNYRSETTERRIRNVAEGLIKYLLFQGEAKLTDAIAGTSGFAEEFRELGPFDSKGRSLRDFDLRTRLFRFPCSYLIYSEAFQELPGEVKNVVLWKVYEILTGYDPAREYDHLSAEDRQAILEILRETKKDLPRYWYP